jgi:hypothetical protein
MWENGQQETSGTTDGGNRLLMRKLKTILLKGMKLLVMMLRRLGNRTLLLQKSTQMIV